MSDAEMCRRPQKQKSLARAGLARMIEKKRFKTMINLLSGTVCVSELNHEPCYICGKKCEVMQSMMHAYADIKVCGDCMIEHLYPFIESKKREIGSMATRSQPQHTLPGCKVWIDYDAVTTSLLIYFDGKPVESCVNWVNSRLATLHTDNSHAIVGVMLSNVGRKQA